jgi:hypothetical protein
MDENSSVAAECDQAREPRVRRPFVSSGMGLYLDCYHGMVDAYIGNFPQGKPPPATPIFAKRVTICPRCHRVILPGDVIVITTMVEWAHPQSSNREQISETLMELHNEKGDAVIFGAFDFIGTVAWLPMGSEARQLVDKLHPEAPKLESEEIP